MPYQFQKGEVMKTYLKKFAEGRRETLLRKYNEHMREAEACLVLGDTWGHDANVEYANSRLLSAADYWNDASERPLLFMALPGVVLITLLALLFNNI